MLKVILLCLLVLIPILKIQIHVAQEDDVTLTITTCNRLDLTIKTIDSLMKFNYNIRKSYLLLDCFNDTFADTLVSLYPTIHFLTPRTKRSDKNLRHMDNIQQLFEMVSTRWWFHCEDDWEFLRPGFVNDSITLLTDGGKDESIYMVIGREPNTFKPLVNRTFGWKFVGGKEYGVLGINSGPSGKFTSYTANPAVIDAHVAKRLIGNFSRFRAEYDVSSYLGKSLGSRVGIFRNHYYKHIGGGRTTMKRGVPIIKT